MKPHQPEYAEVDNLERMCIDMGYRCRACGTEVTAHFSLRYPEKHGPAEGDRAKKNLKEHLMRSFRDSCPEDCEEAFQLNVVREIHES